MKRKLYSVSLKMLFIYPYRLNTQNNYLEICKYLLSFTYILVLGFKFVYRGGR